MFAECPWSGTRQRPRHSAIIGFPVVHVGVAGAVVVIAGGVRPDAAAALAGGVACIQAHLGAPDLLHRYEQLAPQQPMEEFIDDRPG